MLSRLLPILLTVWLLQSEAATCSRAIRVAAIPVGSSFTVSVDQDIGGAYPALLANISRETGCRFEYIHMPVIRAHVMLKNGEIDLIPITVQTPERDQYGDFIGTSKNRLMVIYLKQNPLPWKTLAQLRDAPIQINVVRGQSFGPAYIEWLADPRTRAHLEEVTSTDQIAQKLLIGRADAIVIPLGGFADSVAQYGLKDKIAFNLLTDVPPLILGTYLSKTSLAPGDQTLLKNALQKAVKKGLYHQLLKQHYPVWSLPSIEPMR